MKDSEFIELLNLYLDHEISAGDAARLEAEVQKNPRRHRVYQDYCRMQKACKMLAQDFTSETSETSDDKVVAFEKAATNQGRKAIYFASAFAAAAACLAVIFVGRNRQEAPANNFAQSTPAAVKSSTATPMVSAAPTQVVAASLEPRAAEPLASDAFSIRNSGQNSSLTLGTAGKADPQFAWIQDVRLAPIQMPVPADQLRFDANTGVRQVNRTFSNGNESLPSDLRLTAIRFQK